MNNDHYWNAKSSLDSILGLRYCIGNAWGYVWNEKTDAEAKRLKVMLPDDEMAALSRDVVENIKDEMTGVMLWSEHNAYGVGPKFESVELVKGAAEHFMFEYLKLK